MKSGAYLVPLAFDSLFNGFRASFGSIILRLSRGSNRPLHNPGGGIHRNHRNLQNENKTGYSPYTPGLINCHTNQVSTRRLLLTNVTWLNLKPPPPLKPLMTNHRNVDGMAYLLSVGKLLGHTFDLVTLA